MTSASPVKSNTLHDPAFVATMGRIVGLDLDPDAVITVEASAASMYICVSPTPGHRGLGLQFQLLGIDAAGFEDLRVTPILIEPIFATDLASVAWPPADWSAQPTIDAAEAMLFRCASARFPKRNARLSPSN